MNPKLYAPILPVRPLHLVLSGILGVACLTGCSVDTDSMYADDSQPQARTQIDPLTADRLKLISDASSLAPVGGLIGNTSKAWACASCHGAEGEGGDTIPALAGLPAGYIAKQLHDYAAGRRENPDMAYVARTLSDDEMAALGKYYSNMARETPAGAALGGDMERGRELAHAGDWRVNVPACYSCHGSAGWGVGQAFPPIAGQPAVYLYQQLISFGNGQRRNDPEDFMHDIARVLSDADRLALADYLASRPPRQVRGDTSYGPGATDDEPANSGNGAKRATP